MNLQGVTRELSWYLESQVREGLLLASGVGWSLVLCFGAAYACYYLSSIAKRADNLSLEQVYGDEYQARTVRYATLQNAQSSSIDLCLRFIRLKTHFFLGFLWFELGWI